MFLLQILSCTKGKQGLSPGLTDESVNFMMVEVDGNAPENKNPKQKLDDGEIIEVYHFFFFLRIYLESILFSLNRGTSKSKGWH